MNAPNPQGVGRSPNCERNYMNELSHHPDLTRYFYIKNEDDQRVEQHRTYVHVGPALFRRDVCATCIEESG